MIHFENLPIEFDPTFEAWRDVAACAGRDDVDFFATPDDAEEIARAKALCAGCPVADECLDFAIETNQSDGIWGGLLPVERDAVRRRRRRELREAS